ncbi:hypothetical protein DPM19_23135 [Actinomadura craniellae]|uniref:Uncharacterized protein n=1 Tax=Actinomadura craniellae TaxID=2231787 RepID=A0A365H1K5_9ACTN|nr:hypothetical protein [Actinomadura craniellae]RAY12906.1 hypothetical protein DPM19_23135 [Actinomadura craniellae]
MPGLEALAGQAVAVVFLGMACTIAVWELYRPAARYALSRLCRITRLTGRAAAPRAETAGRSRPGRRPVPAPIPGGDRNDG